MSTMFQAASPARQKLDPLKRVNYTFGLVLGVDEFLQSDTYFLAKHHLENRLLHGYGTVCGLEVLSQSAPNLEIKVTPGWAVNPKGQEIYVPELMCLQVSDWLTANQSALENIFPAAPHSLQLCVVLCSRECKTDVVPIPGEPCQTQTTSSAPSRIADSFELKLCLSAQTSPPLSSPLAASPNGNFGSGGLCEFQPIQPEELGVQAFAWLLSQLQPSTTGPFLSLSQLEQLVLDLRSGAAFPGSPPIGPPYTVHTADLPQFRRAAFRTWITQVRPFFTSSAGTCCPPRERCVLLAEATVALGSGWSASSVTIDDSLRPFLVPTSLLQELFIDEPEPAPAAVSTVPVASPYQAVAAGYFTVSVNGVTPVAPTFNNLTVQTSPPASPPILFSLFTLSFTGYSPKLHYIVKGTVQQPAQGARATFELVSFSPTGIQVSILSATGAPLAGDWGFMVEISQIGGAS